ncbi:MAG TPA: hypothetical protein VGF25_12805 [Thermoleophilaceae bacterium]
MTEVARHPHDRAAGPIVIATETAAAEGQGEPENHEERDTLHRSNTGDPGAKADFAARIAHRRAAIV